MYFAAQAPHRFNRGIDRRVGKDHRELVAPDTKGAILHPERREQRGQLLENGVAVQVAVPVVDDFEVVDVQQRERQRLSVALRARHFTLKLFLVGAMVSDTGEIVDQGCIFELADLRAKHHLESPLIREEDPEGNSEREKPERR